MRAPVAWLLAISSCLCSGLAVAQTVPVPAAKPVASNSTEPRVTADNHPIAALRELAVGAELSATLEDLESVSHAAPTLGPNLPERPSIRGGDAADGLRRDGPAASAPDGPLGKLVGPAFGDNDRSGADWGLSVGLRKDAALRPALPGAGPDDELGVGAGVRVGLSDGVTLGGGYGYFSDDWAGYLRDDRPSARPSDPDDLGTGHNHVAGLRLTFQFEPSPTLR